MHTHRKVTIEKETQNIATVTNMRIMCLMFYGIKSADSETIYATIDISLMDFGENYRMYHNSLLDTNVICPNTRF